MIQTAEYKVPNGKLLRATVDTNGTINAVSLHGDFFIYPEEELETITTALEGCPTDIETDELRETIIDSLSQQTKLVGFTPADVATVIQQALEDDHDEE